MAAGVHGGNQATAGKSRGAGMGIEDAATHGGGSLLSAQHNISPHKLPLMFMILHGGALPARPSETGSAGNQMDAEGFHSQASLIQPQGSSAMTRASRGLRQLLIHTKGYRDHLGRGIARDVDV